MFGFLRVYLYWSVLWGLFMHPALGLKPVIPGLLIGMDTLLLLVSCAYIWSRRPLLAMSQDRQILGRSLQPLLALAVYGLGITALHGGSLVDAAKYVGVLVRPLFVMLALFVWTRVERRSQPAHLLATLRLDFALLATVQMLIAGLQLVDPATGAEFIAALNDNSSAVWALEDGDVSGTFANSIDLSYFLLAAYVVLTLPAWQRVRLPSLLLTGLYGFFIDATGSDAATVCFGLYAFYLCLRTLSRPAQRTVLVSLGVLGVVGVLGMGDQLIDRVVAKVDNMMLSRLGLLFVSVPEMVSYQPAKLITGMGGDFEVVLAALRSLPEVPLVFTYDESAIVINDVFWVALTLAFGLPMLSWLLWRMAQIFRAYVQGGAWPLHLFRLDNMLLLIIFLAGLINQIILVRSFSVALLLGLVPIACHARNAEVRLRGG